jgi:hypothetical protein
MNKAFTILCITKDDVMGGQWGVKSELVISANAKRKIVQSLSAVVSHTDRTTAGGSHLMPCHTNGCLICDNRQDGNPRLHYLELRPLLLEVGRGYFAC